MNLKEIKQIKRYDKEGIMYETKFFTKKVFSLSQYQTITVMYKAWSETNAQGKIT